MFLNTKKNIKTTKVYDTYWQFACERQNIFVRRMRGEEQDLTDDPILSKYKFTNTYRACDRVSQYLIKNVIYNVPYSEEDTIFRILLFKTFNNIDTWEKLESHFGTVNYSTFNLKQYGAFLNTCYLNKERLYSGAYIMASGKSAFGYERKFMNHLSLIDFMMKDHIVTKITMCKSLETLYTLLLTYPTIGSFLAYQYTIDLNYTDFINFDEMEFVVAGPGAKAGIRKCFCNASDFSYEYLIRYMCDHQKQEFERLNLNFIPLGNRDLQLIDCQNIFCETDKYSREKHPDITDRDGRTRIKQRYKMNKEKIDYFFPPKWEIDMNVILPQLAINI